VLIHKSNAFLYSPLKNNISEYDKFLLYYISPYGSEKIYETINDVVRPLLNDDKLRLFKLYEERIELYQEYANYIIGNNGPSEATVEKLLNYVRGVEE
jgi:shikimate kinase